MAKNKGLKNINGNDIDKYLSILYTTEKPFDDIWQEFCNTHVKDDEKEIASNGEYANPVLKELKNKFLEFYDNRETTKKEIEEHIKKINDEFNKV